MLAVATGSIIGYTVVVLMWVFCLWLILTERIGWTSDLSQTTWIYCPHCDNELVADLDTVCVDQWRWRKAGVDPDDLVEDWHNRLGPPEMLLSEYMGLTEEQYSLWVEYPPVNEYEVVYKCGKCKGYSAWDFDHYPAPILTRQRLFGS